MKTEDLDELVRRADPARDVAIPPATSAGARWRYAQLTRTPPAARRRRRRRRRAAVGLGIGAPAVAAALVLALLVVPGPAGPGAAGAVLDRAASAAEHAPSALGPGQYRYTETETGYHVGLYQTGSGEMSEVATARYEVTNQAWTDASGEGRNLITVGALGYPSPADQATWDANRPSGPVTFQGVSSHFGQSQAVQPILSGGELPTDPAQLASVIARRRLQVNGGGADSTVAGLDAYQLSDGAPYSVFEGAAVLLIGPTSGMTPALAGALLRVMAAQPGARPLGTVTDHDGRSGEGVADTAHGTAVDRVVVDPMTGRVLEAEFALPPTSGPAPRSCSGPVGQTATTCATYTGPGISTAPVWTDVVASGVVGSPTATVAPAGALRPVATRVPGAPIDVIPTALPGGAGVHLTWSAPADQGTGPVTGYVVAEDTGGTYHLGSPAGATAGTELTLPDATPAGTFTVQAVNAFGSGSASASASAEGPSAPGTTPAG